MRFPGPRICTLLIAPAAMLLVLGCVRGISNTQTEQTPAAIATASPSASAAPILSATATPVATVGNTPVSGATFTVGTWTVIVERFRAQVNQSDGVNIRSSPEVKPDNRTGSLPGGATVEVEGRVDKGQEAVAGQGTTWYYLGTAGNAPQFIYGPTGTLTPLSGSATAVPPASPSASASVSPSSSPAPVSPTP
jgi:hypothetical protein